ncbi:sulfurtransferase complex subunit TusB [Marinobacterium aestuariivivens]|uniref:Sulfurtransferase complex subunit TusB n=1 Tax=Marinobacterium aestuariivivens TaxID=1698799 RepID=A0ABW2A6X3_9GAMM
MTLHTLNRAASNQALIDDCLAALVDGDALLLLEDGVYCALEARPLPLPTGVRCYALAADVSARGLDGRLASAIEVIDDADFVRLCCEHERVLSWF